MTAVALNQLSTTRPRVRYRGVDGAVYRLGTALVAWSRARAIRQLSLRELAVADAHRRAAWARRDDDQTRAMERAVLHRMF